MGIAPPGGVPWAVPANGSESEKTWTVVGCSAAVSPLPDMYSELIQSAPAHDTHAKCLEDGSYQVPFMQSFIHSHPATLRSLPQTL